MAVEPPKREERPKRGVAPAPAPAPAPKPKPPAAPIEAYRGGAVGVDSTGWLPKRTATGCCRGTAGCPGGAGTRHNDKCNSNTGECAAVHAANTDCLTNMWP